MNLAALLPRLHLRQTPGFLDVNLRAVSQNSREVGPEDLFVAIPGATVDGRRFGAGLRCAAILAEGPVEGAIAPVLVVEDARAALAIAAAALAGDPARHLPVVGITGTNGKTTTSFLIEAIVEAAGQTAAVIGTTGHRVAGRARPASHTTPEAPVIQGILAEARAEGCAVAVMEVSSIGLSLRRVDALPFAVGVFTNLSRDHLDFHGTMEAYAAAKARLFRELLAADGAAIVNGADPAAAQMAPPADLRCWTYGIDGPYDLRATHLRLWAGGCEAQVATPAGAGTLRLQLTGAHNVENALAALGAGLALGLPLSTCLDGLAALRCVPGRLEEVGNPRGIKVFVDYAHTPDALTRVLATLRPLTAGRLLTLFGCGGDRDPGKRPLMGAAACAGSDLVMVTSDNPRSEDPAAIVDDIRPGLRGEVLIELDRAAAIAALLDRAAPGDVVLLAGKGHETTQTVGGRVLPFDDRAVAAAHLSALESP